MKIETDLDIIQVLVTGIDAGKARSGMADVTSKTLTQVVESIEEKWRETLKAIEISTSALRDSAPALLSATDGLFNVIIAVANTGAARRRSDRLVSEVTAAFSELNELTQAGIPPHLLPPNVVDMATTAALNGVDPLLSTRVLLALAVQGPKPEVIRATLADVVETRLWALHALVLSSVAAATPTAAGPAREEVKQLRKDGAAQVQALTARLHDLAKRLRSRQVAGPGWAAGVWVALDTAETWVNENATRISEACGLSSADRVSEPVSRDAAMAYDAVRTLLALVAGGWSTLNAWATADLSALERFAEAAPLKRGSATLDLPRSSLKQAAAAAAGTVVEISGMITDADIRAGGPAPRSVLTVGPANATHLTVLVPFIAVDSFGVQPSVWVHVRGEVFPSGKDDLTGPVVQARRIRREEASRLSFFDHLVFAGREMFELRPGGLDLVAGRLAASEITVAELGLRS